MYKRTLSSNSMDKLGRCYLVQIWLSLVPVSLGEKHLHKTTMFIVTVGCMKDINESRFMLPQMRDRLSTYRIAINRGT